MRAICNWQVRGITLALAFGVTTLVADETALPPPDDQPAPGHESEQQTIAKCLVDLQSEDAAVRHRAVLILGKYNNRQAVRAVIQSLADPSAVVRRSALVSITEGQTPADAREPVMRLLADPDVHIRRIASSFLPGIAGLGGIIIGNIGGYSEEIEHIIVAAYADEDATVRKNMVNLFHMFRRFLPPQIVLKLLRDPEREIRVLALRYCASNAVVDTNDFVATVAFLVDDPDHLIRLQLAQLLSSGNRPGAETLLTQLVQDADFEVSSEALCGLFALQAGTAQGPKLYPQVRQRLDDPRLHGDTAARVIRVLPRLGPETGVAALSELLQHDNAALREQALGTMARAFPAALTEAQLLGLLHDRSPAMRNAVGQLLQRQRFVPEGETVAEFVGSPYVDVRRLAIRLSRSAPATVADALLMELLLDADVSVRVDVLTEISRRKQNDWLLILEQSLTDDDPAIQRQAAFGLLQNRSPATVALLQAFAARTEDEALRQTITSRLQPAPAPPPRR